RHAELVAKTLAGHCEDVPVGTAHRRLEIFSRSTADVEDVALFTDENPRRGMSLYENSLGEHLKVRGLRGSIRRFGRFAMTIHRREAHAGRVERARPLIDAHLPAVDRMK